MPGVPPVLTQAKVVDYSFMDIKDVREIVELTDADEAVAGKSLFSPIDGGGGGVVKLTGMTTLRISSNEISDISGLYSNLTEIVEDCDKIKWIDLSYNKIPSGLKALKDFTSLYALNLHANGITRFDQVSIHDMI